MQLIILRKARNRALHLSASVLFPCLFALGAVLLWGTWKLGHDTDMFKQRMAMRDASLDELTLNPAWQRQLSLTDRLDWHYRQLLVHRKLVRDVQKDADSRVSAIKSPCVWRCCRNA